MSLELTEFEQPTIVEVWAPSCAECRAMAPHLEATAAEFSSTVELVKINAADEPKAARELGVMGTPTLIGFRDGAEVFRYTGRRGSAELRELFEAIGEGRHALAVGSHEMVLRVGTGVVMIAVGSLAGPIWPVIGVGAAAIGYGLVDRLRR